MESTAAMALTSGATPPLNYSVRHIYHIFFFWPPLFLVTF